MQDEVLPHRQLTVEREGLRHVADAAARVEVARIHRPADQRDMATAQKRAQSRTMALVGPGNDSSGGLDLEPWTSTTPSRMADARERAEAMERSLEELPDDVREIVRLRLFEDLPIEDIAGTLGLGESAVRHRFRKGTELYGSG